MDEKEIDISGQRIKQVTQELLNAALMVVILCDPKLLPALNWPDLILRQVPDPYESTMEGVRIVRDEIEKIVLGLINDQEE